MSIIKSLSFRFSGENCSINKQAENTVIKCFSRVLHVVGT